MGYFNIGMITDKKEQKVIIEMVNMMVYFKDGLVMDKKI